MIIAHEGSMMNKCYMFSLERSCIEISVKNLSNFWTDVIVKINMEICIKFDQKYFFLY